MSDVTLARFVGGKADGRTYAFPGIPPRHMKIAIAPPMRWLWSQDPTSIEPVEYETKIYRLCYLAGQDKDFFVYRPDEWTMDDMYEHLLYGNGVILSEH